MDRFIEYGYPSSNALLVDTDGEREIDNITEFINTNETLLISSTYKSMDVLCECLELFNKNDTLFVVDEFHNLSKANISDENNPIYKLLISDHKVLFVSATPRIYDIEEEDYYNNNDMLIGNIVYEMTFKDAIENKYITDYKIWVPFVKENTTDLDKELSIYDIEIDVKNRCKFLFSALANNGSRKCIVYCKDTNDMKDNIDAMIKMNEFYALDIDINRISCEDSEKTRKKCLTYFSENNDNIQLLYSIKILMRFSP
jgi:predicted helicase